MPARYIVRLKRVVRPKRHGAAAFAAAPASVFVPPRRKLRIQRLPLRVRPKHRGIAAFVAPPSVFVPLRRRNLHRQPPAIASARRQRRRGIAALLAPFIAPLFVPPRRRRRAKFQTRRPLRVRRRYAGAFVAPPLPPPGPPFVFFPPPLPPPKRRRVNPDAVAAYREAIATRGQPVIFRRINGAAPDATTYDAPIRAIVMNYVPKQPVAALKPEGSVTLGARNIIVLEEDLRHQGFPLPVRKHDKVVVFGEELDIIAFDAAKRAIAGAIEIVAEGT